MRKEALRRIIPALLLAAILLTALVELYVLSEVEPIGNVFGGSPPSNFGGGWKETDAADAGEESTSGKLVWTNRKTIAKVLPNTISDGQVICFETRQQALRVYIGERKVYEAGTDPDTLFGQSIGSMWNLVPLRAENAGETITVELLSSFQQASRFHEDY